MTMFLLALFAALLVIFAPIVATAMPDPSGGQFCATLMGFAAVFAAWFAGAISGP